MLLLELGPDKHTDHDRKQAQTFDKCGGDNHSRLNFARSIGLTTNGFHGAAADAANAQTNAQRNQTSPNTSAHDGEAGTIITCNFSGGLQQERKKHDLEKRVGNLKKGKIEAGQRSPRRKEKPERLVRCVGRVVRGAAIVVPHLQVGVVVVFHCSADIHGRE